MRSSRVRFAVLVALLSGGVAQSANAQTEGFALDRFEPADRGSDWFVADSLDIRGHGRLHLGMTGDWAHKPLVLYDSSGTEQSPIIRNQFFAHLGGSLVLWERLRIGVNLPLLVFQSGDEAVIDGNRIAIETGGGLGDLRIAADARLFGVYRERPTLAAGLQLFAPTGDEAAFAGDGGVRLGPRLAAAGELGSVAYAGQLGFLYRQSASGFAGPSTGSEMFVRAAIGLRFASDRVIAGPELYGATVVAGGAAAFSSGGTPVELLFGTHYSPTREVRVGAGFGAGLTRGFGSPLFRGVAAVEWAPAPRQPAKPKSPRPKLEPAPRDPAPDPDGDGVLGDSDACPDVPGVRHGDSRRNGCRLPDGDRDGVADETDACPDAPGPRSDNPEKNGCPRSGDRDRDGVADSQDACPDVRGDRTLDPRKSGCPEVRIEAGEIKIRERVEFQFKSAELRPESERVLGAVLGLLEKHPELTKVSVEGHTDNRGGRAHNLRLSEKRARAVVDWLVQRGIAETRLGAKGVGAERPIDSNDSERGRQNNRRVEFHILENDGMPMDSGTPNPGF